MNSFNIQDVSVETLRKNILIEASAGTGKTFNLERIYVKLIEEGALDISQILVVTFTRKATNEIQNRVRMLLKDKKKECQDPIKKQRFQHAYDNFSQAKIYTIHGFCNAMLTRYPFESGESFISENIDSNIATERAINDLLRLKMPQLNYLTKNSLEENLYLEVFFASKSDQKTTFLNSKSYKNDLQNLLKEAINNHAFIHYNHSKEDILLQGKKYLAMAEALKKIQLELRSLFSANSEIIPTDIEHFLAEKTSISKRSYNKLIRLLSHFIDASNHSDLFSHFQELLNSLASYLKTLSKDKPATNYLLAQPLEKLHEIASRICPDGNALVKDQIYDQLKHYANAWMYFNWIVEDALPLFYELNRKNNQITHDESVLRVRNLIGNQAQESFLHAIRRQFHLAIIDEFQDTDLMQWEIFESIFVQGNNRNLILIGDPKQSIYRFRGSDPAVYHRAIKRSDEQFSLATCYRSEQSVVDAYNFIASKMFLANDLFPINYTKVESNHDNVPTLLAGNENQAGVHFLFINAQTSAAFTEQYEQVIVEKIHFLLDENNRYQLQMTRENTTSAENLQPKDIAILVDKNAQAKAMSRALNTCGIPAVNFGDSHILDSEVVTYIAFYLRCLEKPHDKWQLKKLLLSPLLGFQFRHVKELFASPRCRELTEQIIAATKSLQDNQNIYQVFTFLERLLKIAYQILTETPQTISETLLQQPQGERLYVDFLQLLEYLQVQFDQHSLSSKQLLQILQPPQTSASDDNATDLRLDKDQNAVKIITMHKSKGLEFPVVFLMPSLSPPKPMGDYYSYYQSIQNEQTLTLEFIPNELSEKQAERLAWEEKKRVFYVALTRAKNKLYLPVHNISQPGKGYGISSLQALYMLMFGLEDSANNVINYLDYRGASSKEKILELNNEVLAGLKKLAQEKPEFQWSEETSSEEIAYYSVQKSPLVKPPSYPLSSQHFLETIPARYSFSSLHNKAHQQKHSALSFDTLKETHAKENTTSITNQSKADTLSVLPAGPTFGSMIHEVLEEIDYENFDEENSISSAKNENIMRNIASKYYSQAWYNTHSKNLHSLFSHTLSAYLPLSHDKKISLDKLSWSQRRHELKFLFDVLPAAEIPFTNKILSNLQKGYFLGFIDLIFEYDNKYYIVDWKTNIINDAEKTDLSYDLPTMTAIMHENGYVEQAKIYYFVLYLFLKQTMSAAQAYEKIGGCFYLFLRGLQAQQDETGVYSLEVSQQELTELESQWLV